ncbi:hypothetical protein [Paraflavitalea speifideaquila]|uniref:hypothetical protein n=1 Tax=Paraflavitalea speifideaquila TaxID=3076558 RepID=UPI0028E65719|nr:hypothetical protein [Paraflavitalea speifideiaquila]
MPHAIGIPAQPFLEVLSANTMVSVCHWLSNTLGEPGCMRLSPLVVDRMEMAHTPPAAKQDQPGVEGQRSILEKKWG